MQSEASLPAYGLEMALPDSSLLTSSSIGSVACIVISATLFSDRLEDIVLCNDNPKPQSKAKLPVRQKKQCPNITLSQSQLYVKNLLDPIIFSTAVFKIRPNFVY